MDYLHTELHKKLTRIKDIFYTPEILSRKSDIKSIARYYKINKLAYTVFHHGKDFIHMGISRSGEFKHDDLLEHAKLVEKYIIKLNAATILELATGRGATSAHLASKHSNIIFNAIDLPDGQIDYAFKKAKELKNFIPIIGDYHDLKRYKNNSVDIVFVIEALCYSNTKSTVYKEVKRILKKDGIFIIIDGYAGMPNNSMTEEEILAKKLAEKGMVINNFDYYPDFKKELIMAGFKIIEEEDVSFQIIPTLKKFERQASLYFSLPTFVAKLINTFFPRDFTFNVLSGYLMITLIKLKIAKYMITIVQS